MRVEPFGKGVEPVAGNCQTRRHGMASALDQQAFLARPDDRCAKVDTGYRTPRTLAFTGCAVERHHERGLACLFLDAPGDDADDARVPAIAGKHVHRAVVLSDQLVLGSLLDFGLDGAAFLVERGKLGCDARGFFGVLGRQQAHAEGGFAHPAPCVDPRPQCEAEVGAGRGPLQAARIDEGRHACIGPLAHHLQSLRHEGAIEAVQGRDVGHRAQRDEVEQGEEVGLLAALEIAAGAQRTDERDGEQEGHAHRGKMPVRCGKVVLVEPVGVHQRGCARQFRRALVVVDHDHVDARIACHSQRLVRHGSAVDGNDQARPAFAKLDQRLAGGAIAFEQAVGDVIVRLHAEIAQQADEQRRTGRPIHVVIAVDSDLLASEHGLREPVRCRVHIVELRRVGQEIAQGRGEVPI